MLLIGTDNHINTDIFQILQ